MMDPLFDDDFFELFGEWSECIEENSNEDDDGDDQLSDLSDYDSNATSCWSPDVWVINCGQWVPAVPIVMANTVYGVPLCPPPANLAPSANVPETSINAPADPVNPVTTEAAGSETNCNATDTGISEDAQSEGGANASASDSPSSKRQRN